MAQRAERMAKHLNLTEDQRARIKAIHEKHKGEMKGQREATQQARKTFFEAAKNPETPVDQLRKLHQTMSDKAFDMLAARRAVRLETRQVLTPEQREKAAEAQGRMGERMKQRRMGARDMRADH
jgi:Spy/CpxP family protein refolding chaperone